jgi:hypothetical protein
MADNAPPNATARHRKRSGRKSAAPAPAVDERQVEVADLADELLTLWRVMPAALARDSAGVLTGDRHAKGAAKGSPATVNVAVVDAAALIETGLYDVAAQAVRMLNLERDILGSVDRIIDALPDWHRSLAGRGQPLAAHIRGDLHRWVAHARTAIGTRRRDEPLGSLCPHHRAEKPTPLRVLGSIAVIAPSLLAGPPKPRRLLIGPACTECAHHRCAWIRERRLIDGQGRATDWVLAGDGQPWWLGAAGDRAFTWEEDKVIRCPHCRASWKTVAEKRMLALMLRQLGDQVNVEALTA